MNCRSYFVQISFFLFFLLPKIALPQNTAGDVLFGAAQVHDVYINFSQNDWWDSLTNNYTADIYMRAQVIIDGITYDTVGVKFKGNSSYNNSSKKKSLKIGLDEYIAGQGYDGLTKFNLNNNFKDPSFMREKLMCDFSNRMGAIAPRCTYSRVYLNNVYWGLYNIVEEVDKTFLKDRITDKKGNLFKGDPHGDLKWLGSLLSSYYPNYELKTNNTANNWSDLLHLIDKINNTGAASFHDSLESVMETTSTLRAWALTNIFADLDSYLGSGHNYFVYDDSLSNKFHYILWDVNEAFGNFNMGMSLSTIENLSMFWISSPATNRPLYNKMLANATYKTALVNEYCRMMDYFNNTLLDPQIDSIKNLIMTDVQNDTNKFYTYTDFLNNINSTVVSGPFTIAGLKPFIQARNMAIVNELAGYSCFVGIKENNVADNFVLFPNPALENSVRVKALFEIRSLEIISASGSKLREEKSIGKNEYFFDTKDLPAGLYFVKVNGLVKKLVISK